MTNNFWDIFEDLNSLYESKEDQEKFIKWAGTELANKFYKIKDRLKGQEKDIYYWMNKTQADLENKINLLLQSKTKSQIAKEAQEGADLLYSDDTWNVYHIQSFEAAKKYGAHTKWCITGKTSGWVSGDQENIHWQNYTKQGIKFYFYINKKDNKKYALAIYPNGIYELFDETDRSIDGITNAPEIEGLPSITIKKFSIIDGTLTKYTIIDQAESTLVLPDEISIIGNRVFKNCTNIETIIIPSSVTIIEDGAFINCTNLKTIKLPDSILEIGAGAFRGCTSLESVKLPENITTLTKNIFSNCESLISINLPNSINLIDSGAFKGCINLANITLPDSITDIGNWAFSECAKLTNVVLPKNLKIIRHGAFSDCLNLENIELPNEITQIESDTFYNCSKLKSIIIPNNVTKIKPSAFEDCVSLKLVSLPKNLIKIESNAFNNCIQLEAIEIPLAVQEIAEEAFSHCEQLSTVSILNKNINIHETAFNDCLIETVYFAGSKLDWNNYNDSVLAQFKFATIYFNE